MLSDFFDWHCLQLLCAVRAKYEKDRNPHIHIYLAVPVALDPRVDPTSELSIYAVSGTDKQPS